MERYSGKYCGHVIRIPNGDYGPPRACYESRCTETRERYLHAIITCDGAMNRQGDTAWT